MPLNGLQDLVLKQMTAPMRLALEARAPWEHGVMLAAQPLLSMAPKGDGHAVLVLPMMFGSDLSTLPLRGFIAGRGYAPSAWDQGLNLGPRAGVFEACLERLQALRRTHGRRVSLIGWSLGGLFARALALQAPDDVRLVICLGTPIRSDPAPEKIWHLYEQFTGKRMGLPEHLSGLDQPLPVPASSIFSRSDGIVPWQASMQPHGPRSECIEVESSHLGLGVHPLALYAIADRLAQPEGQWRAFEPGGVLSWLYRNSARGG
jgi:pimeloyl-ACP methyl ester carboxylesterase